MLITDRLLHKKSLFWDFSVQPQCSLCLCGVFCSEFINHRGTENTEVAQRRAPLRLLVQSPTDKVPTAPCTDCIQERSATFEASLAET
jgi:hypothetical protein